MLNGAPVEKASRMVEPTTAHWAPPTRHHGTACPSGLSNYLIGGVLDTDRQHKESSARLYVTCSRAGAGRCIR